jgi:succinyl-CoA synthetase alpha subunit
MIEYGTNVVAGVTPGKGGERFAERIPIFDRVADAVAQTDANASVIYVRAPFAADAVCEAADAGVAVVVCISEGIPARDMARVVPYLVERNCRLVGPNCPGLIAPGKTVKVGIMPGGIHVPGSVGVVSRSGTLTYEVVYQLTSSGFGQSTCIGIGGDPIIGTNFIDALGMFQQDDETQSVVLIGEIGGTDEEEAARFIVEHVSKPVVAFAPPGKRMGHAGAIVSGGTGTAKEKIEAFENAGIRVASIPSDIPKLMAEVAP